MNVFKWKAGPEGEAEAEAGGDDGGDVEMKQQNLEWLRRNSKELTEMGNPGLRRGKSVEFEEGVLRHGV